MVSVYRFWFAGLLVLLSSAVPAFAGPYIVVDVRSGEVLASDRSTDPWYPASITKLMTLYVAASAVRDGKLAMTSTLTISKAANGVAPSKMGFAPGTEVTMENAFPMLIVKSANDIAAAIAERVSGSQAAFVAEMNRTAARLGMKDSHFANPHGLPSKEQHVTARDMAVLGVAIHRDFPELLPLLGIPAIRHGKRVLQSYNLLLEHYRGASGMKTGFTCASGLNMVASARRGGRDLVAVVLGELSTIDRTEKAALLLENGFSGTGKKPYPLLETYVPSPTRAEPVDMRAAVCSGNIKIRAFQIVVPPAKPKQGFFARDAYVSPQRKDFGPGLGDPSHPQGTLVHAPRGRTYRSHILQPYLPGEILDVYSGAGQRIANAPFTVDLSAAALARGGPAIAAAPEEIALGSVPPHPRLKPDADVLPATASAFINAGNGVGAAKPAAANSSLHRAGLASERQGQDAAAAIARAARPLAVELPVSAAGGRAALLPRRNPVR